MGKMYHERTQNIAAFRGCKFSCVYCTFGKMLKLSQCDACRTFTPHSHLESLNHKPSMPLQNSFVSIGLSSDISFMPVAEFRQVIEYCRQWGDRTFLIQSKDPEYFIQFNHYYCSKIYKSNIPAIPDNVILGTTIETNKSVLYNEGTGCHQHYSLISKAPLPEKRYETMLKLNCRTAITIEPILDFDIDIFEKMILSKHWDFIYIGYANDGKEGKRLRLPEPELQEVYAMIDRLKRNCYGTEIRIKTLRPAWYEEI